MRPLCLSVTFYRLVSSLSVYTSLLSMYQRTGPYWSISRFQNHLPSPLWIFLAAGFLTGAEGMRRGVCERNYVLGTCLFFKERPNRDRLIIPTHSR